jgi:hypothetical protein
LVAPIDTAPPVIASLPRVDRVFETTTDVGWVMQIFASVFLFPLAGFGLLLGVVLDRPKKIERA